MGRMLQWAVWTSELGTANEQLDGRSDFHIDRLTVRFQNGLHYDLDGTLTKHSSTNDVDKWAAHPNRQLRVRFRLNGSMIRMDHRGWNMAGLVDWLLDFNVSQRHILEPLINRDVPEQWLHGDTFSSHCFTETFPSNGFTGTHFRVVCLTETFPSNGFTGTHFRVVC